MLASATHPAAMRRYALAGFDLHPTLVAGGTVHRESLPSGLQAREGTEGDLDLAAEVDRQLRGSAHGPDLEFMLQTGCRLFVAERRAGRGYALLWEGSPAIVAANTLEIAVDLLWFCLAQSPDATARYAGSRAPRTGRSRWCLKRGSRSPPKAPSASGEISVPSPPTCPAARSSSAVALGW